MLLNMLSQTNNSAIRRSLKIFAYLFLVSWLIAIGVALYYRQNIIDWWRLRGYIPPNPISQLATEDTMSDYTRHLFYLNRPQLLSAVSSFRANCPENKDTIVLGCYHPGQNGIYIYDVADPTLAGVLQVTAAHEVLHSIYARLSPQAKNQLNNELEDYFKNGLTSQVVKEEIKLYQQTEPNAVFDEMDSTFGTEISQLPAPLETYYKQYFKNRLAIVAHEQNYESAFSSRQAQIKHDDATLAQMKVQIDSKQAELKSTLSSINSKHQQLTSLQASGNTSEYNAGVAPYNALVDSYNDEVNGLSKLIAQYNSLVSVRNQIAGQYTTLAAAIDTRTAPVKQTTH